MQCLDFNALERKKWKFTFLPPMKTNVLLKRSASNLPSRWKSRASSYCRDFRIFARRRSVVFNKSLSHICLGSLTLTFPRPQLRLFFQCRRSSGSSLNFGVDGAWGQSLDQSAEADGGKYQICATPASEASERAFSLISSFLSKAAQSVWIKHAFLIMCFTRVLNKNDSKWQLEQVSRYLERCR